MSHAQHPRRDGDLTPPRGPGKRWIAVVAVVLMLAALAAYVLSNDEQVVPDEPLAPPAPAAP